MSKDSRFQKKFKSKGRPNAPRGPRRQYNVHNQLKETEVGITEFLNPFEGFSGIIKARYSDFHVNEIDLNGVVAKLTDRSIPRDFQKKLKTEEPPNESPLEQIPQEIWTKLKEMSTVSEILETVELAADDLNKEQRTEIHECLKKMFGRKISADTVTTDGQKVMVFKKFDKNDDRVDWPSDKGEYVHFLVYKELTDTLEATIKLAQNLKMPAAKFTYAGTKDRRAKTTQWFSVRKVPPWKLITRTKGIRNLHVGNICFKDEPLKLGDLSGNLFKIALRNVTADNSLIENSLNSIKENGYINYFGLQRFGNDKDVPTFSVGVQLLLGNFKQACQLILKLRESDDPNFETTRAKKIYTEVGNIKQALDEIKTAKTSIEYLLLAGLHKENQNDYVNALANIPRNSRILYVHSFQSLVWNLAVSERIKKYGLEVVPGDLILVENNENVEQKGATVRALEPNEVSQYCIYDIVLTLPGYDVTYPSNLIDFYQSTLETYGLTLEMSKQSVKDYSVPGTYRKILGKLKDLSWKLMCYDDPTSDLIQSDLDVLCQSEPPQNVEGGAYKALILEFSLNSASYATMVLRELLKMDTSSGANSKLNNYHCEKKTEEVENEDEKVGLLNDAKKFEAFKNLVFGEDDVCLKRKAEEDGGANGKIAKLE